MDKLSSLPAEVIDLILEKLPLIDRVKTSVLATCWRFRWTRLSSLPLGLNFYELLRKKGYSRSLYAHITTCLVLQQQAGCVREFFFYIPHYPSGLELFHHSIQRVAKSNDITRLYLEVEDEALYPVPSSIFYSKTLRHLNISHMELCLPPWFDGFPNLISFELTSVLSTLETVSRFVSVCPKLEKIVLEVGYHDEYLHLTAPKLKHLHVRGNISHVSVSNGQNLESVSLYIASYHHEDIDTSVDLFKFFTGADLLQHVSLNGLVCKLLGSSRVIRKLPRFGRMKTLVFYSMLLLDVGVVQCFLGFLAHSPNVRELKLTAYPIDIEASGYTYDSVVEKLNDLELESLVEDHIDDEFEHLVSVDLGNIVGSKIEMKIIELLLRFSPALEIMVVSFMDYVNKDVRQQLCKEIMDYYQASTKVKFQL